MHYTKSAVIAATGTPVGRIQRLLARGHVKFTWRDLPAKGSGDQHRFSRDTAIVIALVNELCQLGIAPSRAASAAREFAGRLSLDQNVREGIPHTKLFMIGTPSGETKIVALEPDQNLEETLITHPTAFVINLTKLISKLDHNLK